MSTNLWWRDNLPKPGPRPYPTQRFNRNSTVMNYLQKCSESDFIDLYRIDKHGLHFFANKLKNNADLMRSTCAGLPIEGQLLVALRYFATGNSIKSLQNTASLSLSVGAVYKCIARVSSVISSLQCTSA